jgi:hypothetical protein
MRKQPIVLYSVLLVIVGIGGYLISGMASLTALIPTAFGILIYASNALDTRSDGKAWLVVTGVLALAAVGGAARGLSTFLTGLFEGGPSLASTSQTLTLVLCVLVLVAVIQRWRTTG